MKSIIIYISIHHENTKKIAEVMSKKLGAELISIDQIDLVNLKDFDLVGMGSGIFHGKHHGKILEFASVDGIKGKDVFIFSTSGTGNKKYNQALRNQLEINKANVIGEFTCKGFDTYGLMKWIGGISKGHPNSKDFLKANEFIDSITKI